MSSKIVTWPYPDLLLAVNEHDELNQMNYNLGYGFCDLISVNIVCYFSMSIRSLRLFYGMRAQRKIALKSKKRVTAMNLFFLLAYFHLGISF